MKCSKSRHQGGVYGKSGTKYSRRGVKPAVPPTPTDPCHAKCKTVLSRAGDCTGRAVCELSCPFDSDALRKPHTLRQPCLNCLVALRSQPSKPLLPATSTSSTSWALPQLIRMTSRASLQYASMSPPGPHVPQRSRVLIADRSAVSTPAGF